MARRNGTNTISQRKSTHSPCSCLANCARLLIFAATTTPTEQLQICDGHHQQILEVLDTLKFDPALTATPFPVDLFRYISEITYYRIGRHEHGNHGYSTQIESVVARITSLDTRVWAEEVVQRNADLFSGSTLDLDYIIQGYDLLAKAGKIATLL
jgi:hypothetical protein